MRKVFRRVAKPDKAPYTGLIIKAALLRCETDTDRLKSFRGDTGGVEPATARSLVGYQALRGLQDSGAEAETALPKMSIKRVKREPEHEPIADADLGAKIHWHGVIRDAAAERIHWRSAAVTDPSCIAPKRPS